VKRLREERKFPGIDALKAQIAADSESAKKFLS
jgi:FAD synthase